MAYDDAKQGRDRRGAPRVETPQVEGMLADRSGEVRCRISNLSRLGACAVSNVALPEMTRVKIRFSVEDPQAGTHAISCEAAVVRSQKRPDGLFELGLFFTTMQATDRAILARIAARGTPVAAR
jgi:hypothetical protein